MCLVETAPMCFGPFVRGRCWRCLESLSAAVVLTLAAAAHGLEVLDLSHGGVSDQRVEDTNMSVRKSVARGPRVALNMCHVRVFYKSVTRVECRRVPKRE